MKIGVASLTVLLSACVTACSGSNTAPPADPDLWFGHRYEAAPPDGYRTVTIDVPDGEDTFRYFPLTFERVVVRPDLLQWETDTVAVEILVKGHLPDACMEMHAFDQKRAGNMITATLQMRRPQSQVCAISRRSYRLYLMLAGGFTQGHYTLKLNDAIVPFTVRLLEDD